MSGDCFPVAYSFMHDTTGEYVLVHGIVTGQPGAPLDGKRFWHAWVEHTVTEDVPYTHPDTGDVVFVPVQITPASTTARARDVPAALYYNLGRIDPAETWRYTREQMFDNAARTLHYGPWVPTPAGVR
jgi:hypothetical protein